MLAKHSGSGHLHCPLPADIEKQINDAAAEKLLEYRADYNIRPSNSISFMPAVATTSGRRSTSPECTYVFMTENFWRRYSREKLRRSGGVSGVCSSGIFLCATHAIIYEQFCATSMVQRSVHDLKLCGTLAYAPLFLPPLAPITF